MATDSYGQSIPYPALSDPPDGPNGFKGLVDGLTQRCNLRYASAAARNAAITAPVAGMQAFLAGEKELTQYDGSAWVTVAAGQSTWTTPTLASGFAHNGNSNGTFQWRLVNMFGEPSVMLRGAVSVTYSPAIPNGGVLMTAPLPASARPAVLRTVVVPCSDSGSTRITLKLDARTDGHLEIFGTNSSTDRPAWIGFNGVFYSL